MPGFTCNVVVVVAGGYPEAYAEGDLINLGPVPPGVIMFHAGTRLEHGQLRIAGGRVFSVAATGKNVRRSRGDSIHGCGINQTRENIL
ncbi:hypothetical protein ABVK25_007915 [Lepraria finkii]|uniref:Phosphoribosylglycinamide synthetase C-domain domain-containing protein n=1 Tax=Lepraria finkii TaxID=1340010 RepID=A0ABR4B1N2_9LECA